jgi:pyridoxine 5-phosphate synthase
VNAGHGLDYGTAPAAAALPFVEELNIGHSIVSRALFVGVEAAVREMLARVSGGQRP